MKCGFVYKICSFIWFILPQFIWAVPVTILTPGGVLSIDLAHAGPTGQLVEPEAPSDAGFNPPLIFAAPLPVGSGARALGQSGAFTAVADDATAASWNPAGLTQLESPEVSAVYRFSFRKDEHESVNEDLLTDSDSYASKELNYLSAVYPFLLEDRNAVVSLNYQEVYDFTQEFSASFSGDNQESIDSLINQTFYNAKTNHFSNVGQDLTIISYTSTDTHSQISQILNSSLLSEINFNQQGTIDAFSPALAIDLSPKLSVGLTLNVYTDGAGRGNAIISSLTAEYEGTSDSVAEITDIRESSAEIIWFGDRYAGNPLAPITIPISGAQTNQFSSTDTNSQSDPYTVVGIYSENNATEDFLGVNATLGALWAANNNLSIGATVDLPWTGKGTQTKRIEHQVFTYDRSASEVASPSYASTTSCGVEYTFPLYWSVGALWRWNDHFYSSLDSSCTHWSQFSYKADGEDRINPLNGESYATSSLNDCWSVRLGSEYLFVLSGTEIPLRAGTYWEQRPSVGAPDEYWGFSLGVGISLGQGGGKTMLDIAYIFEQGNNVMGSLIPNEATRSDSIKHQLFISAIWHF